MVVTTPLMRYHGGKFRLAPWIMAHFPPPSAYDIYVEPFGGAAGVLIENRDALSVLAQHDSPRTLHYVDPPYLHETRVMGSHRRYYRHELTDTQHEELLEQLKLQQGFVLVSGYDSERYARSLQGWRRVSTIARISAGRGTTTRQEHLWLNPRAARWVGQMAFDFPMKEFTYGH